ncbi:hypothetical protein AGMMS4957_15850 [Bacteroidia bacterium]|nr:hypothetical protein AGMMS4957_15850 [Bacteroidia bacterium]
MRVNLTILLGVLLGLLPFTKKVVPTPPITLNVATAGTLPSLIAEDKKYQITSLTLTGVLDGTDIHYIRDLIDHSAAKGGLKLNLEKITIARGGGLEYFVPVAGVIPNEMFYECTGLAEITLPSQITAIGDYAFYGCTRLTTITIPNGVTSIGNYAFAGCTGLTEVKFGEGVTAIGGSAFFGCSGLGEVTIPNRVTTIGESTFAGCKNATSIIIGEQVTAIGNSAFANCPRLTEMKIPGGVTTIGKYVFAGCTGLNSVAVGAGVESIGDRAFAKCMKLTTFTISNNLTSLGDAVFAGTRLKEIHIQHVVPLEVDDAVFDSVDPKTCHLYIPKDTHSTYWVSPVWGRFANITEE